MVSKCKNAPVIILLPLLTIQPSLILKVPYHLQSLTTVLWVTLRVGFFSYRLKINILTDGVW